MILILDVEDNKKENCKALIEFLKATHKHCECIRIVVNKPLYRQVFELLPKTSHIYITQKAEDSCIFEQYIRYIVQNAKCMGSISVIFESTLIKKYGYAMPHSFLEFWEFYKNVESVTEFMSEILEEFQSLTQNK